MTAAHESAHLDAPEPAPEPLLHASVYEELRRRLITGKITPGVGLSTRGLAQEMGVSQMPVREALGRLSAEGAVVIRSKRRIEVAPMTPDRFTDLLECRRLLEPEAAVLALPRLDAGMIDQLRRMDADLDRAIAEGDVIAYMECNAAFHFSLSHYGAANLVDQHRLALDALEAGDADGMGLIGRSRL